MKRITHKCPCGAEAVFEDSQDKKIRYVDDGSGKDLSELDDEYVVEFWARNFLASHAACRQAKREIQSLSPKDLQSCTQCSDLCLPDELTNLGNGRIFCEKCCREQSPEEFINPKPHPDECAERRANRADKLGEDCVQTLGEARARCEALAKEKSGVFHCYPCRVGGEDHWHIEEINRDLVSFPRESFISQYAEAARQQERERIAKDIGTRKLKERKERDASKGYEPLYFTDGFIEGLIWAEQVADGTIKTESGAE